MQRRPRCHYPAPAYLTAVGLLFAPACRVDGELNNGANGPQDIPGDSDPPAPRISGPEVVDFGVVPGPTVQPVEIRNEGGLTLSIQAAEVHSESGRFDLVGFAPAELEPGSTLLFGVGFDPTPTICNNGTINVISNDPHDRIFVVRLAGCGIWS
ncbi:MAG: hypothetical protein ABIO70_35740 [Pseudomonadota bacterium]